MLFLALKAIGIVSGLVVSLIIAKLLFLHETVAVVEEVDVGCNASLLLYCLVIRSYRVRDHIAYG